MRLLKHPEITGREAGRERGVSNMASESPDSERSKSPLDSFLYALYGHMSERSDSASKIAHPDPQVREFYRVFLEFAPKFEQQLRAALARRVYLDPTHIADLLLRTATYL